MILWLIQTSSKCYLENERDNWKEKTLKKQFEKQTSYYDRDVANIGIYWSIGRTIPM